MISVEQLQKVLTDRFGGSLSQGQHPKEDQASGLELLSVVQGIPFTDSPQKTRTFNLHPINDMDVTPEERTTALLPVLSAYAGSMDWPVARQRQVVQRIVVLTVQRLVAELPALPDPIRRRCRVASTLVEAAAAARAAREAAGAAWEVRAAEMSAWDAEVAAWAAEMSAWEAGAAGGEAAGAEWSASAARAAGVAAVVADEATSNPKRCGEKFRVACALWLEAAR